MSKTIEHWISNLGRPYDVLVAESVIPDMPLQELYKGRDWLDIEPEGGVELSFCARTRILETLYITLLKTTPSTVAYRGELPERYATKMNQTQVREFFGEPMASKGPFKMPKPVGMLGSWDAYRLDSELHPLVQVMFQYTVDLQVKTLVFTLLDK